MAGPAVTRIHHYSPSVRDLEASVAWYQSVFGWERLPMPFPHYGKEDTGHAVLLLDQATGLAIGLHTNVANKGEVFDEANTGLDHISFEVADRGTLEEWVKHLESLGIDHTGIRDETVPFPYSTVVFRDPDNIQLELISFS